MYAEIILIQFKFFRCLETFTEEDIEKEMKYEIKPMWGQEENGTGLESLWCWRCWTFAFRYSNITMATVHCLKCILVYVMYTIFREWRKLLKHCLYDIHLRKSTMLNTLV